MKKTYKLVLLTLCLTTALTHTAQQQEPSLLENAGIAFLCTGAGAIVGGTYLTNNLIPDKNTMAFVGAGLGAIGSHLRTKQCNKANPGMISKIDQFWGAFAGLVLGLIWLNK